MAGLADLLLGKDNGFSQWADQNQNWLGAIGAGLGAPGNVAAKLGAAAQYAPGGRAADTSAQQKLDTANQTKAQLHAWGYDDLVPFIGTENQNAALTEAFRRKQGGVAQAPTTDIQNYEYGQSHPGFAAAQTQKSGAGEVSLTPTYLRSPDGKTTVVGQLTKNGTLDLTKVPDGYTVVGPAEMAGDKATTVVDAKTAGAARSSLPGAEQAYAITQRQLDRLMGNPATGTNPDPSAIAGENEQFGNFFGIPQQWTGATPTSYKADFRNIVDQLSGDAFLQIRQALKGAGQVTDFEGMKGEIAISRMKAAAQSGSADEFNRALKDYKDAMDNGMRLLREQATGGYAAGQDAVTGAAGGTPSASGGVVDYTQYFGGQ